MTGSPEEIGKIIRQQIASYASRLEMKENGRSVGIFISDLGYGSSGSGKAITAYAPLLFEIELTQKPE